MYLYLNFTDSSIGDILSRNNKGINKQPTFLRKKLIGELELSDSKKAELLLANTPTSQYRMVRMGNYYKF